ncbi:unnamed protein product, partial [Leptidea sinapis]
YQSTYYDDLDSNFPVITLEVLSTDIDRNESDLNDDTQEATDNSTQESDIQLVTEQNQQEPEKYEIGEYDKEIIENASGRSDALEYMMRNDGRVVCKVCGEVLQSRTHWYRHKYKFHIVHPLNPSPLFQCEQCKVYFKSRKGYIGHIASRHSETLADSSPVLTNTQAEALSRDEPNVTLPEIKDDVDPEMSIPKTSVPNYQTAMKNAAAKTSETKRKGHCRGESNYRSASDRVEKRIREEKLVADIIARVRKECEAQGGDVPTRRGYSRRTTVMHT